MPVFNYDFNHISGTPEPTTKNAEIGAIIDSNRKPEQEVIVGNSRQKISNTIQTSRPQQQDNNNCKPICDRKFLELQEARKRLDDPKFLPTHREIRRAFKNCRQLDRFCQNYDEETPVFEFLNEEYVDALADYLISKIQEYGADETRPLVILEIGAGNGRLAYFLRQKLEKKAPGCTKILATDSGEWRIMKSFPVERLRHDEAIKKYSPDIVIFSWMPPGKDCTKEIRECPNVKEYILIGESDGGCCGDQLDTWGFLWGSGEFIPNPLYAKDGFTKEEIESLSKLQLCRPNITTGVGHKMNDGEWGDITFGEDIHSTTVSFKRITSHNSPN